MAAAAVVDVELDWMTVIELLVVTWATEELDVMTWTSAELLVETGVSVEAVEVSVGSTLELLTTVAVVATYDQVRDHERV